MKANPPKYKTPRKIQFVEPTKYCDNYTVIELKQMAKAKPITGYSKMKKAELCESLNIKNRPQLQHPIPILSKRQMVSFEPIVLFDSNKKRTTSKKTSPKNPTDKLIPVEISTGGKKTPVTMIAYMKPCDFKNLVFPCTIKKGVFVDKNDLIEYQKMKEVGRMPDRMNRAEHARLANIEAKIESEMLKSKKPHTSRVRFDL